MPNHWMRRLITTWFGLWLVACGSGRQSSSSESTVGGRTIAGLLNTDDQHAPDEIYQGMRKPNCDRSVEILGSATAVVRPFTQVSVISVACYHGALSACRRRLIERACEVGGDAVISSDSEAKTLPMTHGQRLDVIMSGQVIRYER